MTQPHKSTWTLLGRVLFKALFIASVVLVPVHAWNHNTVGLVCSCMGALCLGAHLWAESYV